MAKVSPRSFVASTHRNPNLAPTRSTGPAAPTGLQNGPNSQDSDSFGRGGTSQTTATPATAQSTEPATSSDPALRQQIEAQRRSSALRSDPSAPVVIQGTSNRDIIRVRRGESGGLDVNVNGRVRHLSDEQLRGGLTVSGGDGDDSILVDEDVRRGIRIEGGRGNDNLRGGAGHDVIDGGQGNDTAWGGAGNDQMLGRDGADVLRGGTGDDYLSGGAGNDTIEGERGQDTLYGLDGNDRLSGGDDRDYIDGGGGDDRLTGGEGDDSLMGGRGSDRLEGGRGADVLAGGHGRDEYNGGAGADQLYAQREDRNLRPEGIDRVQEVNMTGADPGSTIRIEDRAEGRSGTSAADPEFRSQAESDLDALRSLPEGRALLLDIDRNASQRGHRVTLRESALDRDRAQNGLGPTWRGRNATAFEDQAGARFERPDGSAGPGISSRVLYNNRQTTAGRGTQAYERRPPVVGLYHELTHAWDAGRGRYARGSTTEPGATSPTPNYELTTVGLPHDHDGQETPPEVRAQPHSENRIRRRLRLAERPRYRRPAS